MGDQVKVNVGDTITLVQGDDRLVREVQAPDRNHLYPWVDDFPGLANGAYVPPYGELRGWRITDVKPKPEPLPSEPGWYLDKNGDPWRLSERWGGWKQMGNLVGGISPESPVQLHAPFTRLVPES